MGQDLSQWRAEIEALTGGRIVTVPVTTDHQANVLRIPPDFPGRAIVRNLLMQESFVAQLVAAHALNVNYSGTEGAFHFILLNLAMEEDWRNNADGLLGHEYGHIWLNALGYRSPRYEAAAYPPCVLTHAGDIVQHVLIRAETARRGFDYLSFWRRNIERWLEAVAQVAVRPESDGCKRAQLSSMYLDTTLGLKSGQWPRAEEFRDRVRQLLPGGEALLEAIEPLLSGADLWDRSIYEYALEKSIECVAKISRGETR